MAQPETNTYRQIVDVVKKHLPPKKSTPAEKFKFRQRKQAPGETISE